MGTLAIVQRRNYMTRVTSHEETIIKNIISILLLWYMAVIWSPSLQEDMIFERGMSPMLPWFTPNLIHTREDLNLITNMHFTFMWTFKGQELNKNLVSTYQNKYHFINIKYMREEIPHSHGSVISVQIQYSINVTDLFWYRYNYIKCY